MAKTSSNANDIAFNRRETRGWLYEDSAGSVVNGVYPDREAIYPDTLMDTPCSSVGVPTGGLPGVPLAEGHTHPFHPGDTLPPNCPQVQNLKPGQFAIYDVKKYGGASGPDIKQAQSDSLPFYIVDRDTIYAYPLGTTLKNAKSVGKRYPRVDLLLKTGRALADFRREDVDVAIRFGAGASADTKSIPLLPEDVFPVASPSLVSASLIPMQVADLRTLPLLHDVDALPGQPWLSWQAWFERAGVESPTALRGLQFTDSIVLVDAAVAGLGVALGRGPNIEGLLARGQLMRLTQDSWRAAWSYRLVAPPANFSRPNVRAFVDWIVAEARGNLAHTRSLPVE